MHAHKITRHPVKTSDRTMITTIFGLLDVRALCSLTAWRGKALRCTLYIRRCSSRTHTHTHSQVTLFDIVPLICKNNRLNLLCHNSGGKHTKDVWYANQLSAHISTFVMIVFIWVPQFLKEVEAPASVWVWKWKFWLPTLGECSHEETVEIASHLGELPLAPFPALAHLGAALEVEVMIVMVVSAG